MKKTLIFLLLCLVSVSIQAQTKLFKGTVVDADGLSVIGATITASGTNIGTVTDMDGSFQIKLPEKTESIVVKFLGFKTQTVHIIGLSTVKVSMKSDNIELQELVVVGYGKQKKATLTGAVGIVKGAELNKRSVASMSTALQGTIAGVTVQQTSGEPGADGANIRIRGVGSVNSSTFPLVLVDGIEMDINTVDMNTVESVSVLKDAASASIYGSRASNGVILITTKRGKSGKMKISYDTYLTSQTPTNMPEVVSAADYLQLELNSLDNAGIVIPADQRAAREKMIQDQRTYKPDNWNRYDTDWKKATMKDNGLMRNNNISLSGGNDNIKYFGSVSYLNQGGLIANNDYSRLNIRTNTDIKLSEIFKLSSEISYRNSEQTQPGVGSPKSIINESLYLLPILSSVRELDGNWGYGKNGSNPVAKAKASGLDTYRKPELLLSNTLTATPIEGMELLAQYSYRKTESRNTLITTPYKTSLRGVEQGIYPTQDDVEESYSSNIRNYFRTQGSYNKKFGSHNAKVMVGFQAEDNLFESFSGSRRNFNMGKYYLNNGDLATAAAYGSASDWSMASLYSRINYDYSDKYLVELSGRYDGSSRFLEENRWGFFPSASLGWVISKEGFFENATKYVNNLKIRASIGTLGNQDIGNYPYASTIDSGYSYWIDKSLASGVAQTTLSNSNITWEKSRQSNIGIDLATLSNRLSITADYYIKDVYDMLMVYPVPYYTGLNATYSNAGDMQNKGWELAVTYKDHINDFNYSVTATLANNENEITKLYGAYSDNSIKVGYPINSYWGYRTDGYYLDAADVANSPKLSNSAKPGYVKYVKTDTSGLNPNLITNNDKVYLGDPFPHYEYGLNLNASYKGFDLTVFCQGVGERSVYMNGIGLKPFANGSNIFTHQLDSWSPDNLNAAYPILVPEANSADNFQLSDRLVQDGSYFRLKNVVFGYSLPKSVTDKAKMDGVRLYVSGQNLLTVSHFYKGYDPEVGYGGSLGGEFYPIMKTFTLGVNVKF